MRLAQVLANRRRLDSARRLAAETLDRARRTGHRSEEADLLHVLCLVELYEGNDAEAYTLQRQSLELARELGGWPWGESLKLSLLATLAGRLGRLDEAESYGREALGMSLAIGSRARTIAALAALALAARRGGNADRAGRLWGAIESDEARAPQGDWIRRRDEIEDLVLLPRTTELERGLEAGRRLTLEEAAASALVD